MASYEKIVGLSQALYEATAEVSRLSGEVSNLKYIKNKLKKKSTEIDYVVTLSENILGEKYDDEKNQEKEDLNSLRQIILTKKREILALLSTKIQNLESDLLTAQNIERNARNALNAALAS
ncbi:MAG: hypothetical protein E7G40_08945 [Streptococcus sp.]|mgnify:FL=1|jgi:hypothetical protein|uniref:hypothetical protein n=1 Tax=Streptococcus TaxID=1301 RepID=UPI000280DC29|nr:MULTISPECIES: hypothetical protein [Streptococcus]EKA15450.1 hypothetical protein GMD2S_05942 [Streptococcus sp. GMD2S]EKA04831.1 hypothetical protein GMD6S_08318 [Streptococcus sp. GMD6S]EKA10700.1 hypothetical protein GMD4S_06542 [Streptococcus sp. GMD4S]EKA17344.1 hypothetical protein GMD1S_06667 [Streptococcus sp. GMD1S]MDO6346786.1 hypothetical protein [Streptococcus sp. GP0011]